jgi:hypothetical protein
LWRGGLSKRNATEQASLYRHKQEKSNKGEATQDISHAEKFSFDLML